MEVPLTTPAGGTAQHMARVTRTTLSTEETTAPMDFELMLTMRNFSELYARVARGEVISREEMAANYFPLPADFDAVTGWLAAKGFTITRQDPTRLSVFARGPISQVADVFQATFARVAADGAEHTSAITAPNLPTALAPALLGISGLQPHLRAHKHATSLSALPDSLTSNSPPFTPAQILKAYGANTTDLTGAGQTIAIVIDTFPADSDLVSFWSQCNISQSLAHIQKVQVINGSMTSVDASEATLDAELTSAVAPGATVRIYATTDLRSSYLDAAYQQIYNDLPSQPGLHQLDLSFGSGETDTPNSEKRFDAQLFAMLASGGVTVFASSGDGGSNPNNGNYDPSATLQPDLPACDPSVTGVGGTHLVLDFTTGTTGSETAWSVNGSGSGGSGGGVSTFFTRPGWQTGPGVPAGTTRLIPDVSIVADPRTGCFIVYRGKSSTIYGGTSVSAPIWAGFCALLNQARGAGGQAPLGLFGPPVYPLIGTTALRDITSGTNGAYNAGAGYDMVTGVGVPVVGQLVQAIGAASFAPAITTQPVSQTASATQNATFSVIATGNPTPGFQWQREPVGTGTWTNLNDTTTYTGSGTANLTVNSVTEAMSGDSFRCVISNSVGTVTTLPAVLVVANSLVVTTLAGQAGANGSADGTGNAARFNNPADLTADSSGNIYVADANNNTIRKITPAGVVATVAGQAGVSGSAGGTGSAARFNSPSDAAVDSAGNLYVSDSLNHTIRKITPAGVVSTIAGLAGARGSADGSGGSARFFAPEGSAIDSSGNLYVADTDNHTIRRITATGVVSTLAGLAGASGSSDGVDSSARFFYPADVTVDGAGNLYVIDTDNHTLRKITTSGVVSTVAGQAGASGSADGAGNSARFFYPTGIAADVSGNLYVADTNNQTIRKAMPESGPVIQTQPQGRTVIVGASVLFSVMASGVPAPTYQWFSNGIAIAGATSATLTLSNVQTTNAGSYTVVVSNALGSVTSSPATLTVNAMISLSRGVSSSGSGGAPSLWFCGLLPFLYVIRCRCQRPAASVHRRAATRGDGVWCPG